MPKAGWSLSARARWSSDHRRDRRCRLAGCHRQPDRAPRRHVGALAHHYFGGKDQIFLAAMRHILTAYGARCARAGRAPMARARLGGGDRAPASRRKTSTRRRDRAWLNFYVQAQTEPAQHPDPDGRPAERHAVSRRPGGLAACAQPARAGRTLGALCQRLHRLAALRAGAGELHVRAAALAHRVYDNAAEFASDIPPMPITCAARAIRPACRARCISSAPTSCTASRSG
jgi:AcrR family transcriptional regulator